MTSTQSSVTPADQLTTVSQRPTTHPTSKEIHVEIESLNKRILDLRNVAAAARKEELASVIKEVRLILSEFEMTADELNMAFNAPSDRARGPRSMRAPAKYVGPNGEQWAGGRGPKPRWVIEALSLGHMLEDFCVTSPPVVAPNINNIAAHSSAGRWRPAAQL